ncbi:MAG: hypothetical protein CMJ85_09175 [Planctomycetes bacterium]|nr:hypothetical protein [Planctomycetota bacterium]
MLVAPAVAAALGKTMVRPVIRAQKRELFIESFQLRATFAMRSALPEYRSDRPKLDRLVANPACEG